MLSLCSSFLKQCFKSILFIRFRLFVEIKHTPATRYLPQLLLLLQSDRLGWIGHLDFVVFTGADSGLGDLDRPLQIGPPHTIHVPKQNHKQVPHRQDFYSAVTKRSVWICCCRLCPAVNIVYTELTAINVLWRIVGEKLWSIMNIYIFQRKYKL